MTNTLTSEDADELGLLERSSWGVTVKGMGSTDEELVLAMARGNRQALGHLYERFSSRVFLVAVSVLKDRALASDLVQDVFMEVWRKCAEFDPERGTARAWLMVRTRSRALDVVRRRMRRNEQGLNDEQERTVDSSSKDSMDLPEALRRVNDDEREVLTLGYFEQMTCAEIAHRLEIPVGTVKSRTRTGLGKLRRFWGERR